MTSTVTTSTASPTASFTKAQKIAVNLIAAAFIGVALLVGAFFGGLLGDTGSASADVNPAPVTTPAPEMPAEGFLFTGGSGSIGNAL